MRVFVAAKGGVAATAAAFPISANHCNHSL